MSNNGTEFDFAKNYDAPQLYTKWYIIFCRVDVVMQVALGTGIISSSNMLFDNFEDIDLRLLGNKFSMSQHCFTKSVPPQDQNGIFQNN